MLLPPPADRAGGKLATSYHDVMYTNMGHYELSARAVYVERGIFSLVRRGEIDFVAGCLASA